MATSQTSLVNSVRNSLKWVNSCNMKYETKYSDGIRDDMVYGVTYSKATLNEEYRITQSKYLFVWFSRIDCGV